MLKLVSISSEVTLPVCRFWRLHRVYLKFVFSIQFSSLTHDQLIYIVTLKCSFNLGNCDFTVMFYQSEIFFVAQTTDLSLTNLKPLLTNFNGQSFLASF